jgi:hypothetical protein
MPVRWLLCAGLLVVPFVWLARIWNGTKPTQRHYDYAG